MRRIVVWAVWKVVAEGGCWSRKEVVQECLLDKVRGALSLSPSPPPPSLCLYLFDNHTSPVWYPSAVFCSSARLPCLICIPLKHTSIKVSPCFFFVSSLFPSVSSNTSFFFSGLLFWREPYSLLTTQPIPALPESVIKHIGPNTQAITRALMFHLHTAGTMVSLYKQLCCCSQRDTTTPESRP